MSTLLPPSQRLVVAAPLRIEATALRRGAARLRVVRTGMGPARARRAAETLAETEAGAVAVAGVCGALDAGLEPGDVCIASELRGPDGTSRALDAEPVYDALASLGLRVRVGVVASAEHLVRGVARERLAASGARAVDMESWWLAPGAGDRPLAVVRVVVDSPDHELLRPAALGQGLRALRNLSALAPGLQRWAAAVAPETPPPPSSTRVWHAVL